jgi:hypothetical protein
MLEQLKQLNKQSMIEDIKIISTYMNNNYYTTTTTFGDIKFTYILVK